MSPKPLHQQTIVVTGASSGIGLATARMAVERGARVVLVARDEAVLAAEASRMAAKGGQAVFAVADVGDRAAVEAAAQRAIAGFGGFDTWVNVAGITIYGKLWQVEERDHEQLMRTNFWGTVHGSLVAVEHLRQAGAPLRVGADREAGAHGSLVAVETHVEPHGVDEVVRHAVVGETDGLGLIGSHGLPWDKPPADGGRSLP